jgi:hypothetical protein
MACLVACEASSVDAEKSVGSAIEDDACVGIASPNKVARCCAKHPDAPACQDGGSGGPPGASCPPDAENILRVTSADPSVSLGAGDLGVLICRSTGHARATLELTNCTDRSYASVFASGPRGVTLETSGQRLDVGTSIQATLDIDCATAAFYHQVRLNSADDEIYNVIFDGETNDGRVRHEVGYINQVYTLPVVGTVAPRLVAFTCADTVDLSDVENVTLTVDGVTPVDVASVTCGVESQFGFGTAPGVVSATAAPTRVGPLGSTLVALQLDCKKYNHARCDQVTRHLELCAVQLLSTTGATMGSVAAGAVFFVDVNGPFGRCPTAPPTCRRAGSPCPGDGSACCSGICRVETQQCA